MNYTQPQIWLIIALLAIGTFLILFSFLGVIGDRQMPRVVMRMLRFTPVAVLPGMVAPLVAWPPATDGVLDPARLIAALATIAGGYLLRNTLWGMIGGGIVLYAGLFLSGQL